MLCFQFKMNEFGLMEMVNEDSPQKSVVDSAVGVNTTDFVTASATPDGGETGSRMHVCYVRACVCICVCVYQGWRNLCHLY